MLSWAGGWVQTGCYSVAVPSPRERGRQDKGMLAKMDSKLIYSAFKRCFLEIHNASLDLKLELCQQKRKTFGTNLKGLACVFVGFLLKGRWLLYKLQNPRAFQLPTLSMKIHMEETRENQRNVMESWTPWSGSLLSAGEIHQSGLFGHLSHPSVIVSALCEGHVRGPLCFIHVRTQAPAWAGDTVSETPAQPENLPLRTRKNSVDCGVISHSRLIF